MLEWGNTVVCAAGEVPEVVLLVEPTWDARVLSRDVDFRVGIASWHRRRSR